MTIQCTLKYTKFNQGEKLFTCRVQIPADTKQCDLFRVARELAHEQDEFAVYEQEVVEFKFKMPKKAKPVQPQFYGFARFGDLDDQEHDRDEDEFSSESGLY